MTKPEIFVSHISPQQQKKDPTSDRGKLIDKLIAKLTAMQKNILSKPNAKDISKIYLL